MALTKITGEGVGTLDSATISSADNNAQLTLKSTDADANVGPVLDLQRDSSSPADNDVMAIINFKGENDASEAIDYGSINAYIGDASDGAEGGRVIHRIYKAGTNVNYLDMKADEAVFNEDAKDIDFRVESASGNTNNTDALKVVASNGQIFSTAVYNWTTSASANVVVTSSSGHLARSTSALKYKKEVRDLEEIDIDSFRPVRYKSRSDIDNQDKDNFGFIADEVHDAGITELVTYDGDVVEGFQYERLTAVLVKTLQEQKKTIQELEARITALENA